MFRGPEGVTRRATQTSNNCKMLGIFCLTFALPPHYLALDNPIESNVKIDIQFDFGFPWLVHTQTVSYHSHQYSTDPGSRSEHPDQVNYLGLYYPRACVNRLYRTAVRSTRHRSVTLIKYSRLSSISAHYHDDNWDCYRKCSPSVRSMIYVLYMVRPRHCTTAFLENAESFNLKCIRKIWIFTSNCECTCSASETHKKGPPQSRWRGEYPALTHSRAIQPWSWHSTAFHLPPAPDV